MNSLLFSALVKSDAERIALQKDLNAKMTEIGALRKELKDVQEKSRTSGVAANRAALEISDLNAILSEVGLI